MKEAPKSRLCPTFTANEKKRLEEMEKLARFILTINASPVCTEAYETLARKLARLVLR